MPKALIVSTFFETHLGGLEIVAGQVARQLAIQGFEVSWLGSDAVPPKPIKGIRQVPLKACNLAEKRFGFPYPIPYWDGFRAIAREISAADVLLIHDSLYITSAVALLFARRKRKPALVIQHIGEIPYRSPILRLTMKAANLTLGRWVLRNADQVVFISEFVRKFFSKLTLRRAPPVIFNGVDPATFRPAASKAERDTLRAQFGFGHAPVALFVGKFVEKKGLRFLREAARLRPQIVWAFAGWGELDPGNIIAANIRVFHGLSGDRIADLYRASDVFVLPSVGEGYPLVVQEALATGLTVICGTDILDADPAATRFLQGIQVSDRPTYEVAEELCRKVDQAIAAGYGASELNASVEFARAQYSWPEIGERYRDILLALIAEGERGHAT